MIYNVDPLEEKMIIIVCHPYVWLLHNCEMNLKVRNLKKKLVLSFSLFYLSQQKCARSVLKMEYHCIYIQISILTMLCVLNTCKLNFVDKLDIDKHSYQYESLLNYKYKTGFLHQTNY